jgi:hypothetical protein
MIFTDIDLEKISLQHDDGEFITVRYNSGPLIIDAPKMYIPFGLEQEYNNYIIKLQFSRKNKDTIEFYNFLDRLESRLKILLDSDELKTQLRPGGKYDPLLLTKIQRNKDKLQIEVTEDNENINIFKLEKKVYAKSQIMIDTIFKKNNQFFYKIKLKKLFLV